MKKALPAPTIMVLGDLVKKHALFSNPGAPSALILIERKRIFLDVTAEVMGQADPIVRGRRPKKALGLT